MGTEVGWESRVTRDRGLTSQGVHRASWASRPTLVASWSTEQTAWPGGAGGGVWTSSVTEAPPGGVPPPDLEELRLRPHRFQHACLSSSSIRRAIRRAIRGPGAGPPLMWPGRRARIPAALSSQARRLRPARDGRRLPRERRFGRGSPPAADARRPSTSGASPSDRTPIGPRGGSRPLNKKADASIGNLFMPASSLCRDPRPATPFQITARDLGTTSQDVYARPCYVQNVPRPRFGRGCDNGK